MDDDRLYALVSFAGPERSRVAEVVVAFETAAAADRFGRVRGVAAYEVGPMGFLVDADPPAPQAWRPGPAGPR